MVKCGIEIHQRLNTQHKLFCRCDARESGKKSGEIKRKLHPVASELGKIDTAAEFESKKGAGFAYDVYDKGSCLVETDEEPPLQLNPDAAKIVLTFCSMTDADIVDEIQVMRKTVIDGSNTSAFQRTAIVGMSGSVTTEIGEIPIQTISLEEESCGIIGELAGKAERYRLDRLGIPLIELATAPVIKNGKEAKAVAEQIGLMLRATGKVMRGIGTIRQDINISVDGGARVEIKGVQALEIIDKVVDNEIQRQNSLIGLNQKIKDVGKEKLNIVDVTELFKGTESMFIREAIWRAEKAFAARLPGMKGLLGTELYPGFRFGTELSGYAQAQGAGGIIHSDENMAKYRFGSEISEMEKKLGIKAADGWAMIVGPEHICRRAMEAIHHRAYLEHVPEETRRADEDGHSYYLRPLPGSARMYPETDVMPLRITKALVKEAAKEVTNFDALRNEIKRMLNAELADKMIRSEKLTLFQQILEKTEDIDPTLVAVTLEDTTKSLRREGLPIERITDEKFIELFTEYEKGLFVKAAVIEILRRLADNPDLPIDAIVKESLLGRISGKELKKMIEKEEIRDVGQMMKAYRLRVDPEEAKKLLGKQKPQTDKKGGKRENSVLY
jgi:glutamyl-tRNA(Gln) amidotransferase subunit E